MSVSDMAWRPPAEILVRAACVLVAAVLGCTPSSVGSGAPSPVADNAGLDARSAPAPVANPLPSVAPAGTGGSAPASSAPASSAPVPPPAPPLVNPVPPLSDDLGEPLPQTDALPSLESESFRRRLELLVSAIASDDAETALPAFFPMIAYTQVKAIAKPERDWQQRLVRAFERDIHEYHQRLGAQAVGASLVKIEVADSRVKYMKPHSEGNRLGYFRALRSRLVLQTADGSPVDLEVTSMISWRGEWYVVHLHGFE